MGARNLGAQEERQREFPEYRYIAILRTKPLKKYCQNVWNVTKAVHRGKFIILNTCIKKKAEN